MLAVNDDQWRRIFPALGRPDLVDDLRFARTDNRVRNYDELYGIVGEQLRDEVENYTVFDVSNAMRERGWQLPAYTFPENRTDLAALSRIGSVCQ